MDITDYETETGRGCIYNGQAGSGKTTKLCEMVEKAKNPLASENVKRRLIKLGYEKNEANTTCFTFYSYFCEWNGRNIDSLEDMTIFIEEFSMVPNKWMTIIYNVFTMFNNKIYLFGDPNQCSPVEG